jgi:hypothetical protein
MISKFTSISKYFKSKISISKFYEIRDFAIDVKNFKKSRTSISKLNIGPHTEVKIKCFDIEVLGLRYRDIRT